MRSDEPSALSLVLPWLALVVAPVVFIALLGGFHPSNERRDWVVRAALALVGMLQLPSVIRLVRRRERFWVELGGLVLRTGIAVPIILFAGSISHEDRGRDPDETPGTASPPAPTQHP